MNLKKNQIQFLEIANIIEIKIQWMRYWFWERWSKQTSPTECIYEPGQNVWTHCLTT